MPYEIDNINIYKFKGFFAGIRTALDDIHSGYFTHNG